MRFHGDLSRVGLRPNLCSTPKVLKTDNRAQQRVLEAFYPDPETEVEMRMHSLFLCAHWISMSRAQLRSEKISSCLCAMGKARGVRRFPHSEWHTGCVTESPWHMKWQD